MPDCPPGLEYLLQIDRFIVSLRGIINSWRDNVVAYFIFPILIIGLGMNGGYRVRNSEGQDIYSVDLPSN